MHQLVQPEAFITRLLSPGEKLLWSGRPRQGMLLRPAENLLMPLCCVLCALAMYWQWRVAASGAPISMRLYGIPLVVIGLYLVVGRLYVDAQQRALTLYGVTDQRVIVVHGLFRRKIKWFAVRDITPTLTERPDKTGTIHFGRPPQTFVGLEMPSSAGLTYANPNCFDLVENARKVYDVIVSAQKAAK